MRRFLPIQVKQEALSARPTLRARKPVAGYARRSDHRAKDEEKDKTQSREMQTEDLREWAIDHGWKENDFHPYFADFGLSGTLRPDQRPDMLRLFDDMDEGRYNQGSVICWQENRLFRDETQIYYNQFIQKCLEHDIVVVVVSPYLMIYDFRDDLLTEIFRWKCKEAADFIKRHIKGWMLPARDRAAWHDGEWAGMGQLPTGFIVDYDKDSPTYKKLIPYWPHAEIKREYYLLFVELGCNISLLYKRLRESPIIFPEFESWVDQRNVNKFGMSRLPGGYFPRSKATIIGILTDPNDIGYRPIKSVIRYNRQGEKVLDHEPIIERELFDLVYYHLAETDLDGNPIKEQKPRRYFHQGSNQAFGLLKFRITSSQGAVRTHKTSPTSRVAQTSLGFYVIDHPEQEHSLYHRVYHAAIPCNEMDKIVVNRLMEHVRELSKKQEDIAEYEQKARKMREERQKKIKQVEKSISDIEAEQKRLTARLGQRDMAKERKETHKPLSTRAQELILDQIDILEVERQKLLKASTGLEEEAEGDLGSLDKELEILEALWPEYTFEKRRSLINFAVKEVIIDVVSTHWLRIQVSWLHSEWGREEMYYWREEGRSKKWTEEEIALLREHYATMPKEQLMPLLPDRSWRSILWCGRQMLKIARSNPRKLAPEFAITTSYSDLEFMRSMGIPLTSRYTNWERPSMLAVLMLTSVPELAVFGLVPGTPPR